MPAPIVDPELDDDCARFRGPPRRMFDEIAGRGSVARMDVDGDRPAEDVGPTVARGRATTHGHAVADDDDRRHVAATARRPRDGDEPDQKHRHRSGRREPDAELGEPSLVHLATIFRRGLGDGHRKIGSAK